MRPGLPRAAEIALSFAGLAIASPLILAAGAGVVLTSGFPVFFRQKRVGRGGRPFTLIKLRSMRRSGAGPRVTARGDGRVTPFGRFLRRSKLDELPELWNVLRGEMSFVGPRPEVAEYVDASNPLWARVLLARPGLTDPMTLQLRDEEVLMASVEGDREAYYRDVLQPLKLRGYCDYLDRRSWRSDLQVILETVLAVLLQRRSAALEAVESPKPRSGP
ncbi:MAG TPA: sugar transferase [Thermoanaerobaculia bacterium]